MDAIGMESLTFLGNIGGLALALLGAGLAAALSGVGSSIVKPTTASLFLKNRFATSAPGDSTLTRRSSFKDSSCSIVSSVTFFSSCTMLSSFLMQSGHGDQPPRTKYQKSGFRQGSGLPETSYKTWKTEYHRKPWPDKRYSRYQELQTVFP